MSALPPSALGPDAGPSDPRPWYVAWFDSAAYEIVYQNRNDADAERLADLIERTVRPAPGSPILDMACGRGRHALLFARRGYTVTGLDLSPNALATARRRAAAAGLAIRFVQADMRVPAFDAAFDGVVNLFTSFGYFDDEVDHQRALDAMVAALKPGGWLVQDFLNAPYVQAHLVPEDERQINGVTVRQRRWIADGRVHKRIALCRPDGDENPYVFTESVRLLTRADFEALYARAGLRLTHTFGAYDGAPHSDATPRLILMAERVG